MRTPLPMNLNVALAWSSGIVAGRTLRTIVPALRRLHRVWNACQPATVAVRVLLFFDAQTLRDIGIDPSEVTAVVAGLLGHLQT